MDDRKTNGTVRISKVNRLVENYPFALRLAQGVRGGSEFIHKCPIILSLSKHVN